MRDKNQEGVSGLERKEGGGIRDTENEHANKKVFQMNETGEHT